MTGHPADAASVSGRDAPRESGPPVAHEMRYRPMTVLDPQAGADRPVIFASCACEEYAQVMTEPYYTLEQLTRLAVMHETGQPPAPRYCGCHLVTGRPPADPAYCYACGRPARPAAATSPGATA